MFITILRPGSAAADRKIGTSEEDLVDFVGKIKD